MIRLAHPLIPDGVLDLIKDILASGHLTGGTHVTRLEEALSQRLPGTTVLAVANGTMASLVAFHVLKEQGVSRLVAPSFCYPSVVSSARILGLDVVLVDIDPHRLNLCPDQLEQVPHGPSTVVMTVDAFGIPGPNAMLGDAIRRRGWVWMEDSACALGSSCDGVPCGTAADLALLSFHPRKPLTTAEGGALLVRDPAMARQARLVANQGVTGSTVTREFQILGYNARLSELHAAIGLAQLPILDELLATRRMLGHHYVRRLGQQPGLSLPAGLNDPGANFQSMVVLLEPGYDRAALAAELFRQGIESTRAGYALHTQPAFRDCETLGTLAESTSYHHRGLALPINERMTTQDVDRVCDALADSMQPGRDAASCGTDPAHFVRKE
jgi:dTDP-4-amino-4,6-dideoxygalactose transaminase